MDWYLYAKLGHIVFAALWIGGGVAMIVLGLAAAMANDDNRLIGVIQQVVFLSERFFIPSSLLTVILGAIMVWLGHSFADLWILLGLAGFAATFVTGVAIIKPAADGVAKMVRDGGNTPAAAALCRRILRVSVFDYVMIVLVVAIMVIKPTAADQVTLAVMAAVLLFAGLAIFARPRGRRVAA